MTGVQRFAPGIWGRAVPQDPAKPKPPARTKAQFVVRLFHGKPHCSIEYPHEASKAFYINPPVEVLDIPDKYINTPNLLDVLIRLYKYRNHQRDVMFRRLDNLDNAEMDDAG